jgi:ribosome-associated protein
MLTVNEWLSIPLRELHWSYARSGGPGGQNVNKVSTKATLSWEPSASPHLPAGVRQRLLAQQKSRINQAGQLQISSDRYRDRLSNRKDCLEKLRQMLLRAATAPRPRRATKPTRASQRRRLQDKRRHGEKKAHRRERLGD